MNRTDLEAIAKVIEEKDLFVLSDEIYSELTTVASTFPSRRFPGCVTARC